MRDVLLNALTITELVCRFFVRANAKFLWKRIPAAIKNVSFEYVDRLWQIDIAVVL